MNPIVPQTTPADAFRMAYAAFIDGDSSDVWHAAYAAAHPEPLNREIYAQLKAGRAKARENDAKGRG
jgi:pectin methylesterase-like acyl-CoA thioesterase